MRFEKWQALGNDYIVIERDQLPLQLTEGRIRKICEAHFGVCADGILVLSRRGARGTEADPSGAADVAAAGVDANDDTAATANTGSEAGGVVAQLEIYNPDGSRAELSGNGAREAILYLRRRGWTDLDEFSIQTDAGIVTPRITGPDTCSVDMGIASLTSKDYRGGPADGSGEIEVAGRSWRFQHVSIGNPQCSISVEDLEALDALDLASIGPPIEADARFPNRTNVSWFTEIAPAKDGQPARIRARIFERGVGETLSSGTGASGAAIAYVLQGGHLQDGRGGGGIPVEVLLDGGELLVEVGGDLRINLTGWARPVFEGKLSDRFIEELHETK